MNEEEQWLLDNEEALEQIEKGLQDALDGNVIYKGSFAEDD